MRVELIPFEGTQEIKLGMNSSGIHSITGMQSRRLKKDKWRFFEADSFDNFRAEYDEKGECVSLEFFSPVEVFWQNTQLIEMTYKDVQRLFEKFDKHLIYEEGCGFVSLKYQIGVFISGTPLQVEAVLIAKENYYKREIYKK